MPGKVEGGGLMKFEDGWRSGGLLSSFKKFSGQKKPATDRRSGLHSSMLCLASSFNTLNTCTHQTLLNLPSGFVLLSDTFRICHSIP